MSEQYYFTLAEAARLLEVNARKLAAALNGVEPVKALRLRVKRKSLEVLYSLEDFFDREVIEYAHSEIKTMFILSPSHSSVWYAFTITEAVRLTGKSRSWISKLIQEGKITKFEGRRIKDWHKKKSLISAKDLSILGLDFKPDDVFKLFTLA